MDPQSLQTDAEQPADPVEELLARCLEVEAGEREGRVRELCAAHPDDAAALRARLARLEELLGGLGASDDRVPEQLGEFRPIERLGGGGMGVVYSAVQVPLGRRVALKLIRPELLWFPGARQRFQREVEAAARLKHPGIVPIYTVGEEAGVPFFAMELVEGATLGEILAALRERSPASLRGEDLTRTVAELAGAPVDAVLQRAPAAWRGGWVDACLELVTQVGRALEHAHARGILHRDVKPSNVLVTPDGRALLIDFGLTAVRGSGRHTRSGAQLGTLPYMPREQALGRNAEVDERSDLYSLGVTLFELLTLQLPYQGGDELDVQRLIAAGDAPSVRARNPAVAADVETVCLVAMDRDAAHRYPDAGALVRDLEHLLAHRPIQARPPGPLLRLRRWTQRRPALATGLALGFLLAAGVPSALYLQQRGHAAELREALGREERARAEADERAAEAEFVSGFLIDTFAQVAPRRTRGQLPDLRDVLDAGARRIASTGGELPRTRARLLLAFSEVYLDLDLYAEALPLAEEAEELLQAEADPGLARSRVRGGRVVGLARMRLGRLGEAAAALESAVALAREHVPGELPRVLSALAHLREKEGATAEAVELHREILGRIGAGDPQSRAVARANLGAGLLALGRHDEAEEHLAAGVDVLRAQADGPDADLVEALSNLALLLRHQERYAESEAYYGEALELARELYGPDGHMETRVLANLAGLRQAQGDLAGAAESYGELAGRLAELFSPAHPDAVLCRSNRAGLLMQLGRLPEAVELYGEVIPLQREAFGPDSPMLGFSHVRLGQCLVALGQLERGHGEMLAAAGVFERVPEHAADAVLALHRVAAFRARGGDPAGVRELAERAERLAERVPAGFPPLEQLRQLAGGASSDG